MIKHDKGKVRHDLTHTMWIDAIGAVLTFGAEKYEPNGWMAVPDAPSRYYSAAMRHLLAWKGGARTDEESGLHHLAHAAVNVLFLLWFDSERDDG